MTEKMMTVAAMPSRNGSRCASSCFVAPALGLVLIFLATVPALGQVEDDYFGTPDASALTPHVQLPNLGTVYYPLDCSTWPQNPPDDGYLASIFGHRLQSGTDFHRGLDLRCDLEGDTCCQVGQDIVCDERTCSTGAEVDGAPIYALVGGVITKAHHKSNNNLVIKTERPTDDISIGETDCDELHIWYQHMRTDYALNEDDEEWGVGDVVQAGDLLGWQGKSGANSVHLHLSTRACTNSRADGDPVGTLDPEFNPFQLIGTDNGQAPDILSLSTQTDGADLLVTVQVETDDPDFDQLQITVYDAPNNHSYVRRLGYNSRLGVDIAELDQGMDSSFLDPRRLSELTVIDEPNPPDATSGFTLRARFENLNLAFDTDSLVQAKAADVFGNTAIVERPLFGNAELGDFVWTDSDDDGRQDVGEPGLAGVTVTLLDAQGVAVASTITDALGAYGFTQLLAGDYTVRFTPPAGYGATIQNVGTEALDSDIDPQTFEAQITLAAGQLETDLDAGFTQACQEIALVSNSSEWRTSPTETAGWKVAGFDDSAWAEHLAPLGFDNNRSYSQIPSGLVSYFRLEFEVTDLSLFDTLDLSLLRDDGGIVYLNGVEVLRSNMPAGPVDATTRALSYNESTATVQLPASHLVAGTNLLAVEVHNRDAGSDQVFDLELRSTVCRTCLSEVVLTAEAGTFIESHDPGDTNGTDAELKLDGKPTEIRSSLLRWDTSSLPSGVDVLHAEMIVDVTDPTPQKFEIYAMNRAWNENEATWNVASGTGTQAVSWGLTGANAASDRDAVALGLVHLNDSVPYTAGVVLNAAGRDQVDAWLEGTDSNHGLKIHGESGVAGNLKLRSDDSGDPPLLRIVYASGCSP